MAFDGFHKTGTQAPLAEINMVPLIDVMLVLLVIFIIAAPLLTHAVKVDLPKVASSPNSTRPENVQLAIRASGEIYWNGESVEKSALVQRMAAAARQRPQPELHLRADRTTQYQTLAEVMAAASHVGLIRIGFVSDPHDNQSP